MPIVLLMLLPIAAVCLVMAGLGYLLLGWGGAAIGLGLGVMAPILLVGYMLSTVDDEEQNDQTG